MAKMVLEQNENYTPLTAGQRARAGRIEQILTAIENRLRGLQMDGHYAMTDITLTLRQRPSSFNVSGTVPTFEVLVRGPKAGVILPMTSQHMPAMTLRETRSHWEMIEEFLMAVMVDCR